MCLYLFIYSFVVFFEYIFSKFYLKAVTLVSAVQERPDSMSSED